MHTCESVVEGVDRDGGGREGGLGECANGLSQCDANNQFRSMRGYASTLTRTMAARPSCDPSTRTVCVAESAVNVEEINSIEKTKHTYNADLAG